MAFDAGFVAGINDELNKKLRFAKLEKIYQPEKSTIVLQIHSECGNSKLIISASPSNPRVNFTKASYENPAVPPMFCMLLRKHLSGSKIISVKQPNFERVLIIEFEARDEMNFTCSEYLVCEIMGKYSNIIFCDSKMKILSAVHIVDFTTSQKRQILPGMSYELPPEQNKINPLEIDENEFKEIVLKNPDTNAGNFFMNNFKGISSLISREIAFDAGYGKDISIKDCEYEALKNSFFKYIKNIKDCNFTPVMICDSDGNAVEYSFTEIHQYGNQYTNRKYESFGELIEDYFGKKAFAERIKQRSADIAHLLKNAENRLLKKVLLQEDELNQCKKKGDYKLYGDLITANIYQLKRGTKEVSLVNYYSENCEEIIVSLDERLSPSQNAQKYYKKYNKAKNAEVQLSNQLKSAKAELDYLASVSESLSRAENENDLNDIRAELYRSGYPGRMTNYKVQKLPASKPMEFVTDGGYRVICGKSNTQNDMLTTKIANKHDFWFHAKNVPGSHTIMFCEPEEDPPELDFTQAAMIAAYYSQAKESENIAVDYTRVKNVKKPAGSKPGFVIYLSNWTAYVTPDEALVQRLRKK